MCLLRIQVQRNQLQTEKVQLDKLMAKTTRKHNESEISLRKQQEQLEKEQVLSSIHKQALQLQLTRTLRDQMEGLASFEILEEQTRTIVGLEAQLAIDKEKLEENVVMQREVKSLRLFSQSHIIKHE